MLSVYLETTIPSYLAAQPSSDLVVAAHQHISREWWEIAPQRFDLFVSEAVLSEASAGDPEVASRRLSLLEGLPILQLNNHRLKPVESGVGLKVLTPAKAGYSSTSNSSLARGSKWCSRYT